MRPFDEKMMTALEGFVVEYQKHNGRSPSLREVNKAYVSFFGNSISKVQRYMQELGKRGLLIYKDNEGISISAKLRSGGTNPTPLVGDCPCGNPMLAVENIEGTFSLPVEIFGSSQLFILRAVGHSMIDAGIDDGDYMIVKQQNTADPGEIIIALIDDQATAKVFLPQKDKVILRPCNDKVREDGTRYYEDIVVDNCEILGVVDKVIHTPHVR